MVAQEVSQLRKESGLLTRQFAIMNLEKVNVVVTKCKYTNLYDAYIEVEEKYQDREMENFYSKA